MIDKITPRPDASVVKIMREDGAEGLEPVITSEKTYAAPFVNAEEFGYLNEMIAGVGAVRAALKKYVL